MRQAPVRHALEYGLFLPFVGWLWALPHAGSRRFGAMLGAVAHAVDAGHRRVALENLAHAFPELPTVERRRIARRCFVHFGAAFADAVSARRFGLVELCRRVTMVGLEHLVAAEAGGRGVILITAHYGVWEILPLAIAQARGPVVAVGRPADNPHFDRVVRELRNRFGNRMVDKRGAVREMFRVLRDGGRLGLLIDQRVRAEEAVDVPFFGRPALTSPIVGRLAERTGVPVVPVFGEPLAGGRYRVEFLPALERPGPDSAEAVAQALTRSAVETCERIIRRAPERWLWLHERWKH